MSIFYRSEIDGLRALAVVPVVLYHAGVPALSGGFLGVDVFFVISGYLITSIVLRDLELGRFSLVQFYERRARRILPALFLVLGVTTMLAWLWMLPMDFRQYSQSLISVVLYTSNFFFFLINDYFATTTEMHPLLHTWTLAVEEQFYIFLPFLLLLLFGKGPRTLLLSFTLFFVVSLGFAQWASEHAPRAGFYLIPSRAWELFVGVLCALLPRQNTARYAGVWTFVGLGLLLLSYHLFDKTTAHPSVLTALPVGGTALIILFAGQNDWVGKLLSARLLVSVGLISYSLYLWHYPLLVFADIRTAYDPSPFTKLALIVMSVALAALTWRFVEQPFRHRRTGALSRSKIFGGATAASAVFLLGGSAVHLNDGLPDRMSLRHLDLARVAQDIRPNRGLSDACNGALPDTPACRTSANPQIAIWGDSFAMHLVEGVIAAYPNVELVQLTKSLCPPLPGMAFSNRKRTGEAPEACINFNQRALDYIARTDSIDIVILSSAFYYLFEPGSLFPADDLRPGHTQQSRVANQLAETLDQLRSFGKSPMIVSPPPANGRNIGHCILNADFRGADRRLCDFPMVEMRTGINDVNAMLRKIEENNRIVWLDQILCQPNGLCRASEEQTSFYRDEGHLSVDGSRTLGRLTDGWFLFGPERADVGFAVSR